MRDTVNSCSRLAPGESGLCRSGVDGGRQAAAGTAAEWLDTHDIAAVVPGVAAAAL